MVLVGQKMSDQSEDRKVASDENPSSAAPDSKTLSGSASPVSSDDTQPDEGAQRYSAAHLALGQLQHGSNERNSHEGGARKTEQTSTVGEAERAKDAAAPKDDQDQKAGPKREAPEHASSYDGLEGKLRARALSATDGSATCASKLPESSDRPPRVITTTTAVVSSVASLPAPSSRKQGISLRRGKWTVEEEAYVARVIQDFNSGFLDAPAGTTLRTYLSEKLQCDPMRITKKFTGEACIGKRVFHPAVRSPSNAAAIDKAQAELESLERRWRRRLEMQQRESAKKAAASAAAAAAATTGRAPSAAGDGSGTDSNNGKQNPILQTASWLDRAKTLTNQGASEDIQELPRAEIMNQMEQVQLLLGEGPVMQQTSSDLPQVVDGAVEGGGGESAPSSPPPEPADKRLRTGAEDAEALVGFLRSVRASAASGQNF